MEELLNVPIILASSSPRRSDLLRQVGIDARVIRPEVDEKAKRGETPKALVARLAREKAEAVVQEVLWQIGAGIIIAADTIVVAPGGKKVLGKPTDEKDAARMLKMLVGRTHEVLTGYCILSVAREMAPERIVRVVHSKVTMRKLSPAHIQRYIHTGEPMDKAGAYAAQGLGMALIDRLSGSYSNVVGLPVAQVLLDLEKKFGVSAFSLRGAPPAQPVQAERARS